ncbi:MAG: UPF0158 family protein [Bacteroidales bacterium]|jgi:hypothetical protein|nr:UPF0158 family protein [Bacteroidales bacterium]HPB03038.1 UPF0158 family protein [Bacteroidales bacterium]
MKVTSAQINEIAQMLEGGMFVYINRETFEMEFIPDLDDFGDSELWEELHNKVTEEWNSLVIEPMETWESFKIMENFIYELPDKKFQQNLIEILNRKRPFAHFKAAIDNSDYRQQWFDFKEKMYEEYVKQQLEAEHIEFE